MIKFITTEWEWDLGHLPISITEKNPYFSDEESKSFSLPFNTKVTQEVADKLQLVTVNNITKYKPKVYGTLVLDRLFYEGYIQINDVFGTTAELTLFFGKQTLAVFDKKLNALPWPKIFTETDLRTYAKTLITKSWPETTHNFPMIYRPDIKNDANYESFNFYVNHYYYNSSNGQYEFKDNIDGTVDGEYTALNRNVMAPFTYLLEVLRMIFKTEGYKISGDFVNDVLVQKIVMVPKKYMERFSLTSYQNFSFDFFNSQEAYNGKTLNVYTRVISPKEPGNYNLEMRVNVTDALAVYFSLTVSYGGVELYSVSSENNDVTIDTNLDINIEYDVIYDDVVIELKLINTTENIADYNNFTFQLTEGQLNVFPNIYSLADYMPDLTVREFTNRIKTWFNLKYDYIGRTVYINYLEKELERITYKDHHHLQQPEEKRTLNKNNLFKLFFEKEDPVMVNKNGRIFSDTDYTEAETEKIEIKGKPLRIKQNYGMVTAVYPTEESDIMLMLYDGLKGDLPLASSSVDGRDLTQESNYNSNWKNWLRFRANSETYTDTFFMPVSEYLNIKEGSFKYNKRHILKTIDRKRLNDKWWQIDVVSETN